MKNLLSTIVFILFISSISFAQQLYIHTTTGTDAYNLADIDSITFTVPEDTSTTGTVTDIDGNVYQTVKIGNQWWMAENLKVTRYRNGENIQHETDSTTWSNLSTGAYCAYNNDNGNVSTYGLLYNWYAAADDRNIAPDGWHVPSDDDWKVLEMYLGMSQSEADNTGLRGSDEGSKLKAASGWYNNGNGTNSSGFTALPGGYRGSSAAFYTLGEYGYWWSSTESSSSNGWRRALRGHISGVYRYGNDSRYGFNVRLVKD